ncbi:MAG: FAD-binding oxidoreductase [Terricaulis sp.]
MKSILVIGGGLIGAACAFRLQQAGIRATLIDPGDKRRAASYGNAGHIGAEQVSPWSTWGNVLRAPAASFAIGGPLDFRWSDAGLVLPWVSRFLGACNATAVERGRAALSALLLDTMGAWQRLTRDIGAPDLVLPHGHVTAWTSARAAERGRRAAERTNGGATTWRDLNAEELGRYAGLMKRPPCAGILFSGTGQVRDPQGARDAILAAFLALGGEIVTGKVTHLDANGAVTLENDAAPRTDAVLIAAGAWSGALMRQLGQVAPLIGERGYHVQSAQHDWPEDLPTTVFEQHFVVFSRFSSGLRATSCIEFGSPDAPGDVRKWRLLERRIGELGVRFSSTPDRWVGSRPTLPDYVPAIGRLARAPNVLYAFGHAHLGLTMCAATAEIVATLATERDAPIDMAAFAIERFG